MAIKGAKKNFLTTTKTSMNLFVCSLIFYLTLFVMK